MKLNGAQCCCAEEPPAHNPPISLFNQTPA
eukprot:UN10373